MTAGSQPDSNVVKCPSCRKTLIAEEALGHKCGDKVTVRAVMVPVDAVDVFSFPLSEWLEQLTVLDVNGKLYRFRVKRAPKKRRLLARLG